MPRIHGALTRRINAYDAFAIAHYGSPPSLHHHGGYISIFGNANLGISYLTNLQMPTMIASDQSALLNHWYARTDILPEALTERQRASLHRVTSTTIVTLNVGDRPEWQMPLSDLLNERPWEPPSVTAERESQEVMDAIRDRFERRAAEGARPLHVPVRQSIGVAIQAQPDLLATLAYDLDQIPMTVWVHLEGISVRDHG